MDPTNPNYYGYGDEAVIECIEYIESHAFDFLEGNVIKYVTRYEQKNGLEDLKKASWYLNRLIKREEGKVKPYDSSLYKSILNANDDDLQLNQSTEVDGERWATSDC
tara:strand:- start:424 stop:744 length:321 start_codon:yes stop_codon:yes gene_type:complete